MVTDEAQCLIKMPEATALAAADATRTGIFGHALAETAGIKFKGATAADFAKLRSSPWRYSIWYNLNFPASVNFAYDFYRPGTYAKRLALEQAQAPLLKSPFLRDALFLRNFADAFVVAKQRTFSVILHTGPVARQAPDDGMAQFKGPLGFGGGQLSAFWTPEAGPLILGLRSGMSWDDSKDKLEQWRLWPIHAVSGCTPDGTVFSSARIVKPKVTSTLAEDTGTVTVEGQIDGNQFTQPGGLQGQLNYRRVFTLADGSLHISSTVSGDGQDQASELYETIPLNLGNGPAQQTQAAVTIQFLVGDAWLAATAEWQGQVSAIKVARFGGAMQISFDTAQRVKLSSTEWKDGWFTREICRNVLIDLLEPNGQAASLAPVRQVAYRLSVVPK
jgi:hypothetical protein